MPPKKQLSTGLKRNSRSHDSSSPNRSITPNKKAKLTQSCYDKSSNESNNENFDDSGLELDSSSLLFDSDESFLDMSVNRRIYKRKPFTRITQIVTSTPLKNRPGSNQKHEVDLWEKAMSSNPKLRSWIEQFNNEINMIDQSSIDICDLESQKNSN